MKRGITAGSFDLLHPGHILMFKECKEVCDYLIVALQSDPTIDRPEKNKPIQSIDERKEMLDALRFVDEIILYDTEDELYKLLQTLPITIRILGADWKGQRFTGDDLPLEVYFNSRNHSHSTNALRRRVYEAEVKK
ncbi:MAG: adenylyltransferase/cytidyltransferase family protein [Candidatus Paceibacterota bacterium]